MEMSLLPCQKKRQSKLYYVNVIALTDTNKTDQSYTYATSSKNLVGKRVVIPFGRGRRKIMGIVIEDDIPKPDFAVKEILRVLDRDPLVDEELISMAHTISEDTLSSLTQAFRAILPAGIGTKLASESGAAIKTKKLYRRSDAFELSDLSSRAYKKRELFDTLDTELDEDELGARGFSKALIREMVRMGAILEREERVLRETIDELPQYEKKVLNEEQQAAYHAITKQGEGTVLIEGVTGSGKTEIYLQLVEHAIRDGKSAIVLVPEIALTPQTIERFAGRFPGMVALYHSKLSTSERYDEWTKLKTGEAKIVVGARSAIFAPLKNIGVIVIDEEHEDSYKSDRSPKYDAREIAAKRAKSHHCPLVLGSATPRIETLYRAEHGEITHLRLTKRALEQALPEMKVIDMREELREKNISMFSRELYYEMNLALRSHRQILLFLNKRGHSSFVFCRNCGYAEKCDSCDVTMTYHKGAKRLICHYCGKTKRLPDLCPVCGSNKIRHFGAGTEKLELETKRMFPNARVERMDFDTTRRKNAYETIYQKMKDHEIDILIGTQMIAKGLDFPNVGLVGVMAADISLNLPNFNSAEKTFSLITQVAGRAGRGDGNGKVIIQTYKPEHYAIRCALNGDLQRFYEEDSKMRKIFYYPPFTRMAMVVGTSSNYRELAHFMHALYEAFRSFMGEHRLLDIALIGPSPCRILRVKDQYRMQILLKTEKSYENMREVLKRVCIKDEMNLENRDVLLSITLDPSVIL